MQVKKKKNAERDEEWKGGKKDSRQPGASNKYEKRKK